ncbi:unnamed protein product [Chondrus crispus]|uniref:Uncharacterized protein n=1 Tax=Chondrus crispus TaxID=2769 RepID=R7QKU2_CHOCR|nr:unnamed protein product [Chondrus crispus]CDF38704.1 unnamed protein product [Chondrus crispus]|eukprot:XP_005718609.1 unnamed protein product [Chondrus crispus]
MCLNSCKWLWRSCASASFSTLESLGHALKSVSPGIKSMTIYIRPRSSTWVPYIFGIGIEVCSATNVIVSLSVCKECTSPPILTIICSSTHTISDLAHVMLCKTRTCLQCAKCGANFCKAILTLAFMGTISTFASLSFWITESDEVVILKRIGAIEPERRTLQTYTFSFSDCAAGLSTMGAPSGQGVICS